MLRASDQRLGKPDAIAGLVPFLTSEDASFSTESVLQIEGMTLASVRGVDPCRMPLNHREGHEVPVPSHFFFDPWNLKHDLREIRA